MKKPRVVLVGVRFEIEQVVDLMRRRDRLFFMAIKERPQNNWTLPGRKDGEVGLLLPQCDISTRR